MGTYSFSMYVLHFAVLDFVKYCIFGIYGHAVSGFTAIGIYGLVFGISLVTVGVGSAVSYRFIELPGIALGGFVNKRYISLR